MSEVVLLNPLSVSLTKSSPKWYVSLTTQTSLTLSSLFLTVVWWKIISSFIDTFMDIAPRKSGVLFLIHWGVSEPPEAQPHSHPSHKFHFLIHELYPTNLLSETCFATYRELSIKSLGTEEFPDSWSTARVTPIYKNGEKDEKSNYRPISILHVISKLFEKLVLNPLYQYLNKKSSSL